MQDFAYKAEIGLSIYPLAVVAAIWIAVLAVSFLAIKAALANPVKSSRTE